MKKYSNIIAIVCIIILGLLYPFAKHYAGDAIAFFMLILLLFIINKFFKKGK